MSNADSEEDLAAALGVLMTSSDEEEPAQQQQQQRQRITKRIPETPEKKVRSSATTASQSQPAKARPPAARTISTREGTTLAGEEFREQFSGVRVKDRLIGSTALNTKLRGHNVCKLRDVSSRVRASTERQDTSLVLLGVVVDKSACRESAKKSQYIIWTVSDLSGTSIPLFLFGLAYQKFSSINTGALVCVSCPSVLPSRGSDSGLTLSVSDANQVLHVGTAMDFGRCVATTKGGRPCRMAVDKSRTRYCVFHLKTQFKKKGAARMDCNRTATPVPRFKQAGQKVYQGVQTGMHRGANSAPVGRSSSLLSSKSPSISKGKGKGKSSALSQLKATRPTVLGRRHLGSSTGAKLLQQSRAGGRTATLVATARTPLSSTGVYQMSTTRLKGVPQRMPGKEQPEKNMTSTHRALSQLQKNNITIAPPNPNSNTAPHRRASQPPSSSAKSTVRSSSTTTRHPPSPSASTSLPVGKKRSFAQVFGEGVDVDAVTKRKSKFQAAADRDAFEKLDAGLAFMEEKDERACALENLRNIKVKVVACRQCRYMRERQTSLCREKGHQLTKSEATKRFFKCSGCSWITHTYNKKFVTRSCKRCGGKDFERSGMISTSKAGTASENMVVKDPNQKLLSSSGRFNPNVQVATSFLD